jgi:CBS domain-containing protein
MTSSLEDQNKKISVRDIMTSAVISVDSSVTVQEAAKMMEDAKVGCMIVMEKNNPVGIITDRDFAIKIASHAYPLDTQIKHVMSTPLIGINPKDSVWMVSDMMHTKGIRKLPVIENDKVIGIVTATDLVNRFAVCTEEEMKKMYHYSLVKIFDQYNPYA